MKSFFSAALALGLVLGLTTMASAAPDKKKKKNQAPDLTAVFAKLDANGDKKVSKDEFSSFNGLTSPKPGKQNKVPKGLAEARANWFSKLDANGDESLTAKEFAQIKETISANPAKKKKDK